MPAAGRRKPQWRAGGPRAGGLICIALGFLAVPADPAPPLAAPQPGSAAMDAGIRAVTVPSEDLTLSFIQPGRIAKVLVREGEAVRAGDPLVQLDDAVERVHLDLLKAKAEDTTGIRLAGLRRDRAKAVLAKVQKAYDQKAAPDRELEEAKADAAQAELTVEIARFEHEQAKGAHLEAKLKLDRTALASPTDGRVERIIARAGQSVDALAGVIRIVRTDPLWVDVPVPMAQARRLKVGQAAVVRFAADLPASDAQAGPGAAPAAVAPAAVATGRILRLAGVADAASETLEVRVELPNPSRPTARPAGEQVTVTFLAPGKP